MPKNVLVASSNCCKFLKVMTNVDRFPVTTSNAHVNEIRDGYVAYNSDGPYRLLILNCIGTTSHYNTLDISFDANSDEIFQYVRVYDSLHKTNEPPAGRDTRNKENAADKVSKLSPLGKFLSMLQLFLLRFCFFENDRVVTKLTAFPEHILANATYQPTPQQTNACDCSLFSLAVVLHLFQNVPIHTGVFSASDVTRLRTALAEKLCGTDLGSRRAPSLRGLDAEFLYSFFPELATLHSTTAHDKKKHTVPAAANDEDKNNEDKRALGSNKKDEDNDYMVQQQQEEEKPEVSLGTEDVDMQDKKNDDDEGEDDHKNNDKEEEDKEDKKNIDEDDNDDEDDNNDDEEDEEDDEDDNDDDDDREDEEDDDEEDDEDEEKEDDRKEADLSGAVEDVEEEVSDIDKAFKSRFMVMINKKEEEPLAFPDDYGQVLNLIEDYTNHTRFRLATFRSCKFARTFVCTSHVNCTFKAKFGRFGSSESVVCLKTAHSNLVHSGDLVEVTGKRKPKRRLLSRLSKVIASASEVKALPVSALDVKKGAVTLQQTEVTYGQAHQVLAGAKSASRKEGKKSYSLIVPYLKEFERNNPGSLATYECDADNHLLSIMVCPNIMSHTLQYVRPIISLDACHMKTTGGGGTLYIASVKSACDHLYPVAFALTVANENQEGWLWFLRNLKSAVPILEDVHPNAIVDKLRFTFISDRQKGLLEAVKEVFPLNHSCYCAVHIARNVQVKFGAQQSKSIIKLAKTFSSAEANYYMERLRKPCREYVERIEPEQWRSTAWVKAYSEDKALPPRFGVVTSNMSEAVNAMFEEARDVHWKSCMHLILTKMVSRISDFHKKYAGREGVVRRVKEKLEVSWNECEGMKVVTVNRPDGLSSYTVFELYGGTLTQESTGFNINLERKWCDCGMWMEYGHPCVHTVAVLRKEGNMSYDEMEAWVEKYNLYEAEDRVWGANFNSVCTESIEADKTIKIPLFKKRKQGRTKKQRFRKRPNVSGEEETKSESNEGDVPESCVTPKKMKSAKGRCKLCGGMGHNRRTCKKASESPEIDLL